MPELFALTATVNFEDGTDQEFKYVDLDKLGLAEKVAKCVDTNFMATSFMFVVVRQ